VGAIDLYCERTDPGLWAEPVNAATNAAFLVSAWFIWRLARQREQVDGSIQVLVGLAIAIAIGSGSFHIFATSTTSKLDLLPIALFVIYYVWLYCRKILRINPFLSTALLVAALAAAYIGKQFPNLLNGSLIYVPVLFLITGLGVAHLWQNRREPYVLIAAAGVFATALLFRTIDNTICPIFPLGTHFLWHLLNAVALYLATRALLATYTETQPTLGNNATHK
jgi:hypothetical protein